MPTYKEVAEWMLGKLDDRYLCQQYIAHEIEKTFGIEFVYYRDSGNIAIHKNVLKEFRNITEDKVVWIPGDKAWRKLEPGEKNTGRRI